MVKFIDLFSGIGGFRLGLERTSKEYECVWSCDWDKYANRVYRLRFGNENHYAGDVRQVDAESIPDHDLLCAGFPCQAFSVAGKRKGFEDARGTLFYEIARIAEAKRPPLLLLENVKGLLSTQRGYCFARILQTLDELGYICEWQCLNSKHFGVPQNRERVFIIGHLRGTGGREIFPIFGESNETSGEDKAGSEMQISTSIDANYWKGADKHGQRTLIAHSVRSGERPSLDKHAWDTIVVDGHHGTLIKEMGTLTGRENRRGTNWALMLGSYNSEFSDLENFKIRRLTPVECERLQGFPDGWTEYGLDENGRKVRMSDTQRYRLLGNAVTVNVVEFLGKRILERCFG